MGRLLRHPLGLVGLVLVAVPVAAALLSLLWLPHDPAAVDPSARWLPASPAHPLGTDAAGRDLVSILLAGARVTVASTALAATIALVLGLPLALLIGLTPRMVSTALERFVDVMIAFPTLVLAIILVTSFGGGLWVSSLAIGLGAAVVLARTLIPELRRILASDYVLLAVAGGVPMPGVLLRHVLPNLAPTLLVRITQIMAVAALAEAGLSYLGFGTPPPTPSWGRTLTDLQAQVLTRPEVLVAPSLAITTVVLGFTLLGDALRDILEPETPAPTAPARRARRHPAAATATIAKETVA